MIKIVENSKNNFVVELYFDKRLITKVSSYSSLEDALLQLISIISEITSNTLLFPTTEEQKLKKESFINDLVDLTKMIKLGAFL